VPSDRLEGVALVTGGGRESCVDRAELAGGQRVAVTGRTPEARAVATLRGAQPKGTSDASDVERWIDTTERELGPIELLVCNAGISGGGKPFLEEDPDEWWHDFAVNVRGAYLCCRAAAPRMAERGRGRIVNIGSGASYLPITNPTTALGTPYGPSKAALGRFTETLAAALGAVGIHVFLISPGLVRTDMTDRFGDDAPWTPPDLAPTLVRVLASGRADALAGRYLHAEHDDIEDLIERADEIVANDLNAIRLRR
jgi:NAD(P)-dependent dehydrogenase (short-subunit alcohol dehydrogenase family)